MWAELKSLLSSAINWIRSVYSEADGNGSSTRVHISAILAFILGVGISFAVAVHHKRISIEQFNSFLGAGGTFVGSTCGAFYGINKLGKWAESKSDSQQ